MATKNITDEQVCRACCTAHASGSLRSIEVLMQMTGEPDKVCLRAMERAERRGLIESGISTATAWVTDAGRELLKQVSAAKE